MEARVLQESMERAIRKCSDEDKGMMKAKKVDWFSFLTDDHLTDILNRLPSVILRYKTRFVCKRWFKIITYMILKEHASFIIQTSSGLHTARQVIVREEKQGLEFEQQSLYIPFRGRIKSWCNEFLLIVDPNYKFAMYVFNLITLEGLYLPWCETQCGGHYTSKCGLALAFDGFKGVYKAIHIYMGPPLLCKITVLERDITSSVFSMWKSIEVPCSDMGEGQYYWGNPVSVQGRYFHWNVHCPKYLVSMDMVKEEIFQIPLPEWNKKDRVEIDYALVEMGGKLSLLDNVSWNHAYLWILKDFRTMKWEKLHSVSVPLNVKTGIYPPINYAYPVCSVISKKYIIFRKSRPKPGLFSYVLTNQVMKELNICCEGTEHCVVHSAAPSFL